MTMRSVDTRFWEDGWIRKLNALDRYMFLYFLTNTHTNWCGVYELDIAMMAFESGIDKEDLERAIFPRLVPKVIYVDGWVYIPNFGKYHNSNSKDAQKGFKRAFAEIPDRIRLKIKEIEAQGGTGGSRVPSASAFTSASALISNETLQVIEEDSPTKKKTKRIDEHLLEVFRVFSLRYPKNWEANTTQRNAAQRLVDEHGLEQIKKAVEFYNANKDTEYCPNVNTPMKLDSKWTDLFDFKKKNGL